jgi:Winged helix DNA-binding domain
VTLDRLGLRALNRATMERQLLLRRSALTARQAVEHLAGLQAQAPKAPYVGLWTRLAGFRPHQLEEIITERAVVRAHLMRNTVHLISARDFVRFRSLYQPLMERALAGHFGRNLSGVDLAALREAAAGLLAQAPLTRVQLAAALAPRWPDHEPASLAYAASHLLPLVQVPPRGLWNQTGPAAFMLADAWLSGPAPAVPAPAAPAPAVSALGPGPALGPRSTILEQLVLRYLAAYGPASVADIQAWSGLTRLREVTERLGSRLRAFAGPEGGRLLDLPDAPRPEPDVPAPPRFLPEYDNLLLSFAERSRVIPHGRPVPLPPGHGATGGTLLVDGSWQADWKIIADDARAILQIRPFAEFSVADRDAIATEGERLLKFATPAATTGDIRFGLPRSGSLRDPGPQRAGQGLTVGAWTTRRSWLTSASSSRPSISSVSSSRPVS